MKNFIFKMVIILAIVGIAIMTVSAIYIIYFNVKIEEHYENIHNVSLKNATNTYKNEILKIYDEFEDYDQINPAKEDFYAKGILETNKLMRVTTDETTITETISQKKYNEIAYSEKSIAEYAFNGQNCIVFSKKNQERYNLFFMERNKFIERTGETELENVILANSDGLIITAKHTVFTNNIYQLVSHGNLGDLPLENSIYEKIEGKKKYIGAAKIIDDYYLIGYTDVIIMQSYIEEEQRVNLFFVIGIGAVSFIGVFFFLLLYAINNNRNLIGKFTRGKFVILIDEYGKILYKNSKFKKEFNCTEIVSYTFEDYEKLRDALLNNKDITLKLKDRKNNKRYIRLMTARNLIGFKMIGSDVTEIMLDYIKAKYKANCDTITGLPSTVQLRLDYAKALRKNKNEKACMAIIEILGTDKIKVMFGNKFYREVLKNFSNRLFELFRETVYYNSDNKFLIFTHNTEKTEKLVSNIHSYMNKISSSLTIENQTILPECKLGYSKVFYPRDRLSLDVPIREANYALYSIRKSKTKHLGVFYDALMKDDLSVYQDKQAVIELIKNDELTLFFQPQYSISKNRIVGFEALARIKKKIGITISEFIELAEKNGSIIEVGEMVYRKAMLFAKEMENEKITIALNVSPVQLMQEGFVENFLKEYKKHNLKKNSIAIEITESFLMSSKNSIITKLNILKDEGIDIHLDDFGIEYSSLLYLKKLPVSTVKIDKEFIKDVHKDSYSSIITETVFALTYHLDLNCIAEGVETEKHFKTLKSQKCDIIQGYYISKAVPKEKAKNLYYEYKDREDKK